MGAGRTEEGCRRRESHGRSKRGTIEDREEVKDEEKAMEDEKVAADRVEGREGENAEEGRSASESRLTSNVPSLLALFFVGKCRARYDKRFSIVDRTPTFSIYFNE